MANLVSSLFFKLSANTTAFQGDMQKAQRRTANVVKEFKSASRAASNLSRSLGLVVGIGTITRLASNAIQAGSAITDMAEATRTGIEEIQILNFAAIRAGASQEQMANLLVRVQKSASDAARGLSTQTEAFNRLGISVDKFINLSPDQMLVEVSKALVAAGDDTRAYGAALDILGTRNAPKLMEVMKTLGDEGFGSVAAAARNAGQVMSEDLARDMDSAADKLAEFQTRITNISAAVVGKIMDVSDALGELAGHHIYGNNDGGLRDFAESQLRAEGAFDGLRGRGGTERKRAMIDARVKEILDVEAAANVRANRARGASSATSGILPDPASVREVQTAITSMGPTVNTLSMYYTDLATGIENVDFGFATVNESIEQTNELMDDMPGFADYAANAVEGLGQALEDSLVNAARNGKFAFGDLADYVFAEIQRILLRVLILRPLFNSIGGLFGGSGTLLGGAFMTAFGGARAYGGSVSGGRSYLVGERGPELFTPSGSGTITANNKMAGGNTYYVDARSADRSGLEALAAAIRQTDGSLEHRAVNAVQQTFQRNPSFLRG